MVLKLDGSSTPKKLTDEIRSQQLFALGIESEVAAILDAVEVGGDSVLLEYIARFDGKQLDVSELRVDVREITSALGLISDELRESLDVAVDNIRSVAEAQLPKDVELKLPQGQVVTQSYKPIKRVGAYVPGGKAAYPTSVLMAAVPARVARVSELVVCTPADKEGKIAPLVLAACAVSGVSEVYRIGGAHAIAALAFGTETVKPVDLIVGPGNRYVQEAKRQVFGRVGIDGIAGPSELLVIADSSANSELVALDLAAQAEHGPDSLLVVAGPNPELLDAVAERVTELASAADSIADALLVSVETDSLVRALELSEELAPEHLELACRQPGRLAESVTRAGCVFVGGNGATAFGDYIAGSNHVLPTGGAARFASVLGPGTFQRRQSRVSLSDGAVESLAAHAGRLADSEGFPIHGQSAEARVKKLETS